MDAQIKGHLSGEVTDLEVDMASREKDPRLAAQRTKAREKSQHKKTKKE